jgi:hypothetical protein
MVNFQILLNINVDGCTLPRAANIGVGDTAADEMHPLVGPGKRDGVPADLRYLEREGVSREGEPGRLSSTSPTRRTAMHSSLAFPGRPKQSILIIIAYFGCCGGPQ